MTDLASGETLWDMEAASFVGQLWRLNRDVETEVDPTPAAISMIGHMKIVFSLTLYEYT